MRSTRILRRLLLDVALPLLVLGAGARAARAIWASRPNVEHEPRRRADPEVEVSRVVVRDTAIRVAATGTVEPARTVVVSAEVPGRVIELSEGLRLGGRVGKGELLLRVDPRAYRLATRAELSRVEQARLELEVEASRSVIAAREWELLETSRAARGGETASDDPGRRLALREPQREVAKVGLQSALSSAARARLDLERTVVRAPFDATVTAANVERGQYVSPGVGLATLVATDQVWIRVAIPYERLAWLDVPGLGGAERGSSATVRLRAHSAAQARPGRIVGLIGELEAQTRRVQLLVAVDDPFEVEPGGLPLVPGGFVDVDLRGRTMPAIAEVPRSALFEGNKVWIVDADQTLRLRTLEIAWAEPEVVYASAGLADGEQLVVGPIVMPVDGMKVRPRASDPALARSAAPGPRKEPPSDG